MNLKRIAQFVRMLSSNQDGELLAAIYQLKKQCSLDNLSLNDLGSLIEGSTKGSTRELSKEDMQTLYEAGFNDGFEKGKKEGRIEAKRGSPFDDVLDNTDEQLKVVFVQKHKNKLKRNNEKEFVDSIIHRSTVLNKPLTDGQKKWLNDIYSRLGGGKVT